MAPVPPAPVAPQSGYPREITARPLVLPSGVFEGVIPILMTTYGGVFDDDGDDLTVYGLAPRVRAGVGSAELEAGIDLLIDTDQDFGGDGPERLTAAFVAARYALAPDQTLGAELTAITPAADFRTLEPRLLVNHKAHLSPVAAVIASVGGGMDLSSYSVDDASDSWVVAATQLVVQAQVAPSIGLQGRATINYRHHLDDDDLPGDSQDQHSGFHQDYGVRVALAATPMVDVIGGLDLLASGEFTAKVISFGVAMRSSP